MTSLEEANGATTAYCYDPKTDYPRTVCSPR
ncbi:hypothetical protein OG259_02195 [Streptomyces sp. NBC_00250]